MITMSTGKDSTLGNYLEMAELFFGKDSGAVKFLNETIDKSPNGVDEEVIVNEGQMILLLAEQNKKISESKDKSEKD